MTWRDYFENILWNFSRLLNAIAFGDPHESLSARIGWNIAGGGFWSRVPMPRCLREHFENAMRWSAF